LHGEQVDQRVGVLRGQEAAVRVQRTQLLPEILDAASALHQSFCAEPVHDDGRDIDGQVEAVEKVPMLLLEALVNQEVVFFFDEHVRKLVLVRRNDF
jgi:hypothetical protein